MHKKLLFAICILLFVNSTTAQISGPASATVNAPVTFTAPAGPVSNTWLFDDTLDFSGTTGTLSTVQSSFNGTGSSTMVVDEQGNWFLFASTLAATGEVYRLAFGQDPNSTPVQSVAATVPGANHLAIDVVRDDVSGNWYGFLVAQNTMWRLDFGNSLTNTATVSAPMSFVEGISNPRQITVKKDGGKWFAFVGNYLDKIGRFEFGALLTNTPVNTTAAMPNSTYQVGSVKGLGNYFAIHKEGGKWYMLATQYTLLYLLDFGSSFENTPTYQLVKEQVPPDNNFLRLVSIGIVADCRNVVAYCMQGQGSKGMMKLNFHGSITNTPTVENISGMTSTQLTSVETAVPYVAADGLYFIMNYWTAGAAYPLRRFKVLSFPAGTTANQASVNKTWSATGNYDVSLYTNMASPRGSAGYCHQVSVAAGMLPQPDPFTDSSKNVCAGSMQVRYTVPAVAGATGYVWSYSGSGHTINGSGNSVTMNFAANAQSGTLSVQASNGGGLGAARTIAITVSPLPAVSITPSGDDTFCLGSSRQITASLRPATRYQWQHNGTAVGQNNPVLSAVAAGVYKVVVTDSVSGCAAVSDSVRLVTTTPPVASISNGANVAICQNDSVVLNGQPLGSGLRYRWIGGAAGINDTNAALIVRSAGNYRIVVTDARQCSDTSLVSAVVVHSRPTAQIQPAGPLAVCQGDSVNLNAVILPGAVYEWLYNGTAVPGSNNVFRAGAAGSYKVVVTNANNCSDTSAPTELRVSAPPSITVTPIDTSFCAGGTVTIQIITNDTNLTYQWQDNVGDISGATAPMYQTFLSGSYSVIAGRVGIAGCYDTAYATVAVYPVPQPSITWNGEVLRTDTGYMAYEWFGNGVSVTVDSTHSFTPAENGAYMVQVTDSNGCIGTSEVYNVHNVGVSGYTQGDGIQVYPNPVTRLLSIVSENPVHITLYDAGGSIIMHGEDAHTIDMESRPAGLYLLRISDRQGNLIRNERIIKFN